jgi:Ser/Thr protein kinase RdoA (MazF antagonist)
MKETTRALLDGIAGLYGLKIESAEALSEGNMNESHSVETTCGDFVFRLAPGGTERTALEASMALLERHCAMGSRVVPPRRSLSGSLVESVRVADGGLRLVTVHEKARGRSFNLLKPGQIPDEGFVAYGAALSRFHENSLSLKDQEGLIPPWEEGDNHLPPATARAFADGPIAARYLERYERCLARPASAGKAGIVHGDLHFSNVIFDAAANQVTFCDFDNACVAPFAFDLAMLVFDLSVILQGPGAASETERITALLLEAYRRECRGAMVEDSDIACFVDMIEAGNYIEWLGYWKDAPGSTGWLQLFFQGRRERLLRDARIFTP